MRIATWNVNSAKQRLPRLLQWMEERQPDVVCLQETKLTDAGFLDCSRDDGRGAPRFSTTATGREVQAKLWALFGRQRDALERTAVPA